MIQRIDVLYVGHRVEIGDGLVVLARSDERLRQAFMREVAELMDELVRRIRG